MIFKNQAELKERIEHLTGRKVRGPVEVFEDASNYMAIVGGSVLRLGGTDYFVTGDAREGRFGIDDQPKFWVKYAKDLDTGSDKIIKLVFHEQFSTTVGNFKLRFHRNPYKESAFLDMVRGDPMFMQGITVPDAADNPIRIIERIPGKSLFIHMDSYKMGHEQYFHEELPRLINKLIPLIEAIDRIHERGRHHGDIRNDHILINSKTGVFSWIDFDYEVNFSDFDVWSMGNLIVFAVGQGHHTVHEVRQHPQRFPGCSQPLSEHDAMLLFRHRVANLKKLFPWIPRDLNDVLMRFSAGSINFYGDLEEQVRDLKDIFTKNGRAGS